MGFAGDPESLVVVEDRVDVVLLLGSELVNAPGECGRVVAFDDNDAVDVARGVAQVERCVELGRLARFEAFLFERYRDQWTIAPKPIEPIRNPRDFIFEVVLQGTQLVPPILKADLDAIGGRDEYDDAYYAAFFKANRAVVERRLNESIAASAAMIAGAWEAAGKPAVPVNPRPTVQRRRR